ncbi:MAG: DUF3080 family protein [Luminiphilus sp.]
MAAAGTGSIGALRLIRFTIIIAIFSIASLLAGCGSPPLGESLLVNYIERLTNTLSVDTPDRPAIDPPRIVEFEIAPIPIETQSIGLIDLLSVTDCELKVNIARRNTLLAKNASPSQKLLLDLEFLRLAPACIDSLRSSGDDKLAEIIKEARELRDQQLPARIFNAVTAGPEWQALWSAPLSLGNYPEQSSDDEAQALNALAHRIERWLSGNWDREDEMIELLLSELRTGAGGSLLLAASTQQAFLAQASKLLEVTTRDELCRRGEATQTSVVLNTVIQKYFAGEVQVWLSAVNQRHYALLRGVESIESSLNAVLTNEYREWQSAREVTTEYLFTAPRTHVRAIKATQDPC